MLLAISLRFHPSATPSCTLSESVIVESWQPPILYLGLLWFPILESRPWCRYRTAIEKSNGSLSSQCSTLPCVSLNIHPISTKSTIVSGYRLVSRSGPEEPQTFPQNLCVHGFLSPHHDSRGHTSDNQLTALTRNKKKSIPPNLRDEGERESDLCTKFITQHANASHLISKDLEISKIER
jgi:hypothetical protein